MVIDFQWNEGETYRATSFDLTVQSAQGASQFGNCVPGQIRVNLDIKETVSSPGKEFFTFARDQKKKAKAEGKGTITVFRGRGLEKEGEAVQTVKFSNAFLTDIDSSISEHDESFNVGFTIKAGNITVSDVEFEDKEHNRTIAGD